MFVKQKLTLSLRHQNRYLKELLLIRTADKLGLSPNPRKERTGLIDSSEASGSTPLVRHSSSRSLDTAQRGRPVHFGSQQDVHESARSRGCGQAHVDTIGHTFAG